MLAHPQKLHRSLILALCLLTIFSLLSSCSGTIIPPKSTSTSPRKQSPPVDYPKAEITFEVQIPAELNPDQNLYAEILDEVTGLALNPAQVKMEKQDAQTYILKMPVTIGSVVKYRYVRDNDPVGVEYTSQDRQVRYRIYYVDGPGIVRDTVGAWKSSPLSGGTGRIQGQVAQHGTNAPVINALVAAGGLQTVTSSDGSFLLEGLPVGMHNLVVYSMDGSFLPFQQGAVVAPESTTPALIQVNPVESVNVTFLVSPPEDNIKGIPVRMVGNIFGLGNMFADLSGGVSVLASRAPLLAILPDGRYSISLKLPVGLYLRYKYTLGDGFWNAERMEDGDSRLRQLIVPDKDITIEDVIDNWKTNDRAPISFTVTVPANTPIMDTVSIQFNPFSWTEPIPMWPAGNNRWFYILFNPFNAVREGSYRFCRNDQCGTADSVDTRGPGAPGISFKPQTTEQNFDSSVDSWAWLEKSSEPVIVPAVEIKKKAADYTAGVEFLPEYDPSWQPQLNTAFQNLRDIGATTVIFSPSWHATHQTPPVMEQLPGKDALWPDMTQMTIQAQQKGLGVVIHPVLSYPGDPGDWWSSAARDDGWWQSWFDRYRTFLLHHADLAAQTGAKVLVIGDETILPALPNGRLANGKSSKVPGDASNRWAKIITELRARYTGKLAWFIPYAGKMPGVPNFVNDLDLIYVQLSTPLAGSDQATQADLGASIAGIIDGDIQKAQEKTGKPIVIGLKFPSVQGALDGCVNDSEQNCLPMKTFDQPAFELTGTNLDLNAQAEAYTATLAVISQRSWITGFYSAGYYPPVGLIDLSTSVHGKPASDVLWYWYPRLTGTLSP
ncbi:MAG: hypothetical protein IH586_13400 [Anaerolineaceae bacterium]|nr:hypothetical protein [Anaerolineaceae bacterium]